MFLLLVQMWMKLISNLVNDVPEVNSEALWNSSHIHDSAQAIDQTKPNEMPKSQQSNRSTSTQIDNNTAINTKSSKIGFTFDRHFGTSWISFESLGKSNKHCWNRFLRNRYKTKDDEKIRWCKIKKIIIESLTMLWFDSLNEGFCRTTAAQSLSIPLKVSSS